LVPTVIIYLQLALGASMRHEHAGLSIPDFPRAYGKWIPDTSPEAVAKINVERETELNLPRTSAAQIWLQMAHRGVAVLVLISVAGCAYIAWQLRHKLSVSVLRAATIWSFLIVIQIILGMYTIWTRKAADVATTHVAVGAISLVWGALLTARAWKDGGFVAESS
jgi:heme a synthase